MPARLPAARTRLHRVLGAGIAALAQPHLGAAWPGRPARGTGDDRPRAGAHTGGSDRPPRHAGRIAEALTAGAGWFWWPAGRQPRPADRTPRRPRRDRAHTAGRRGRTRLAGRLAR